MRRLSNTKATKVRADGLHLLGDIVDLQSLKSRSIFPEPHLAYIAEIVVRAPGVALSLAA